MGYRPDWNNTNFKKTPAVRKYADGSVGGVDEREAARDNAFSTPLPEREPIVDTYEYGRADEQQANRDRYIADMKAEASKEFEDRAAAREAAREMPAAAPKKQSFKEAFASAKDGSVFTWEDPKTGKVEKYKKEYAKPAPQGDQKVKKMYEDEVKIGRQYREAAAKVTDPEQKKIILNAAAESDNRARLYGAGYANSTRKK